MFENVEFFQGLDKKQLAELESGAGSRTYKKGSIILSEGDESDSMFVIVAGQAQVYRDDEQGKKIILATMSAGESFGELAIFSGEPRSANVIVTRDCEVKIIRKKDIEALVSSSSQFATRVIQRLSIKVIALTEKVSILALKDNYGRIVRVLEEHANNGSITGKLTQQDIADQIGSSREMVSRILKDLRLGGYIEIDKKRINILKPLPKAW
jgi:CRP/FNR family cyclic AMP-dependent transcriptional regulator